MIQLLKGDCIEIMKDIPDKSIDAIICDPPYGTTQCKWDSVIPFEPMWEELHRIIKDNGAIVLFGSEPFLSALRMSNIKKFKYDWIWNKIRPSNFFAVKFQPLNNTENIMVFSDGGCNNGTKKPVPYHPQGMRVINKQVKNSNTSGGKVGDAHKTAIKRGEYFTQTGENYPKKIIKFIRDNKNIHPTQKPIKLMEYLILTYTIEGETVLDFAMGSGTTGVACKNLNRKFIGIEKDENYFNISKDRIENTVIIKESDFMTSEEFEEKAKKLDIT